MLRYVPHSNHAKLRANSSQRNHLFNGNQATVNAEGSVQTDRKFSTQTPPPSPTLTITTTEARIRELERELAKKDLLIEAYKHEQKENTNLIAMYEDGMGNVTEMIRNYCNDIETRFLGQRRHYNNLLQQEKNEHLQSRIERDFWENRTIEVSGMIRHANRLRTDEWCEEYAVIAGLQGQVRCLRRVLGMDVEKPEEEVGWPYLKDLPLKDED
jgi:hypothetical protein